MKRKSIKKIHLDKLGLKSHSKILEVGCAGRDSLIIGNKLVEDYLLISQK